ncbi:MAG TPA: ATP-binding protein [Actinomycetota bacterium]
MNSGNTAAERATRGALLIEFCGLPGAGKSHLAGALLAGLRREGIPARAGDAAIAPNIAPVRRIPRKLLAAGSEVLSDPVGAARVGLAIARAERDAVDIVSRSLQWFVTQRVLDRAAGRAGVHVFGEGVLQGLWSIGLRGDPDALLELLEAGVAPWIRPRVLVVVNAPTDVADARLGARRSSHSRTQALGAAERTAELRRGRELLECLVEWWRASSREGEIVEVDNGDDGPRDREVARLVNRILKHLGPAAQPEGSRSRPDEGATPRRERRSRSPR